MAIRKKKAEENTKKEMASKRSPPNPILSWEATLLVSHHLDPKTLAVASCVSKLWHAAFSSDHIWKPICLSHFPSSLHFPSSASSYRSLFSLLSSSSAHLVRRPPPPRLALPDLLFAVDVFRDSTPVLSFAKTGDQLGLVQDSIFRFDVDVGSSAVEVGGAAEEYRVGWTVVMRGFRGAFCVMRRVEKGKMVEGNGLWFTEVLPSPGCCSVAAVDGGKLEAELGMVFGGGGGRRRRVVEKVRLGLMSSLSWRYLGVEDGLLYLQNFLLPA